VLREAQRKHDDDGVMRHGVTAIARGVGGGVLGRQAEEGKGGGGNN
jgi:hypothetical protein